MYFYCGIFYFFVGRCRTSRGMSGSSRDVGDHSVSRSALMLLSREFWNIFPHLGARYAQFIVRIILIGDL